MNTFEKFVKCLICEISTLRPLEDYKRHYLVQCDQCGFVFCERKPTIEELKVHYSLYTRANAISPITIKRYHQLLDRLEPYRQSNNLIDVGCGDGYFLEEAKKRRWNVFGTEFTLEAVKVCEGKGIKMTLGTLDPSLYSPEFFDVITSFEVIEHINNPIEEVGVFSTLLRKGGVVYVTTPNFNSISRNLLKSNWNIIEYPEHLSYYSAKTLVKIFQRFHFKAIKVEATGVSLDRLSARKETNQHHSYLADELIRQRAEHNVIFRLTKKSINFMLNFMGKGDALKALFVKQ